MSETQTITLKKTKTKAPKAKAGVKTKPATEGVKKKKRSNALATGNLREIKVIKQWQMMDGWQMDSAAREWVTNFLFRELRDLTHAGQTNALRFKLTRVSARLMKEVAKGRMSAKDQEEYTRYADEKRALLNTLLEKDPEAEAVEPEAQ